MSQTKSITLLINYGGSTHVSLDTLKDFESAIGSVSNTKIVSRTHRLWIFIGKSIYWIFRRVARQKVFKNKPDLPKYRSEEDQVVKILMGPRFEQCLPDFFFIKRKSIYLFDAWEDSHMAIANFVNYFSVECVFLSSHEATEKLKSTNSSGEYHWIPEAIEPSIYRYFEYANKDIDVIQLGRKYDSYHSKIVGYLLGNNFTYLYEKEKGQIIFPSRDEFVNGLARSKISICVPSSITHPERSGSVSTMTNRYLQSMASKCLVVGVMPEEMKLLFNYNPIIEIDDNDPCGQLTAILKNFDQYVSLIEKNFEVVAKNHAWSNRWIEMKRILEKKIHEM